MESRPAVMKGVQGEKYEVYSLHIMISIRKTKTNVLHVWVLWTLRVMVLLIGVVDQKVLCNMAHSECQFPKKYM